MHEQTFDDVYRKLARPLLKYITRVTGDATLAEDILQKTFFNLLGVDLPEMDSRQMKNYVYKIATNLIADHWRSTRRLRHFFGVFSQDHRATRSNDDLRTDVRKVFETLKPQERSLLWLAYVEGATHAEIAGILGLQEGSIKVLLHRARRRLASALEAKGLTAEVFA
jgi:RNA polymerase sigma-70 factor, ECF subfamily